MHVLSTASLTTIGAEVGVTRWTCAGSGRTCCIALDDPTGGLPESHWTGGHLTVGGAVLEVTMPTIRCVVPSRAQPGLDVDRRITRAVATRAQRRLGSNCWVKSGGPVAVGDVASLRPEKQHLLAELTRRTKRLTFGLATSAADRFSR